jgi:hypothetical protein
MELSRAHVRLGGNVIGAVADYGPMVQISCSV